MSQDASAVHFDGSTLVVCDGPELLVYNQDGTPRWKQFCDGMLVDVRASPAAVVVLDIDGRLTRYRPHDGLKLDEVQIEGGGLALDLSLTGIGLVRTPTDLVLVDGTSVLPLNQGETSAAGFGPDRSKVGVGWENGVFRSFDLAAGTPFVEQDLGAPIRQVRWSSRGAWVVVAGPQVVVISEDGRQIQAQIPLSAEPKHLSTGSGGVFASVVIGHNQVCVVDLHANKVQGTIDFRREIGGTAWGTIGQLVIGLDDGDASRVDVFSGGSIRTEPHPGRGRNNWNYEEHLERDALRGSAAFARAGTDILAKFEGAPEESFPWWQTCLGVTVVSILLCMGCTGCSGLLYYLRTIGVF